MRLDKRILETHPGFSRARIEGLVKAGFVRVNGKVAAKAGAKVSDDDEITVEIPPPVPAKPLPEDIPVDIVYEDGDIIVVDKPAGLVVHPAPGHHSGTLVNALLGHCPEIAGIGCGERPGIVHRLDQDTSGLMVVAKSRTAMERLARAFADHGRVSKTYLAVCHRPPGRAIPVCGRIENLIGRHPVDRKRMAVVERGGKRAVTTWRIIDGADFTKPVCTVECRIETGRTHQIRVHMASIGCPVAGDGVYGRPAKDKALSPVPARQMLHAWKLEFEHPVTGARMSFLAPPPEDMAPYIAMPAD